MTEPTISVEVLDQAAAELSADVMETALAHLINLQQQAKVNAMGVLEIVYHADSEKVLKRVCHALRWTDQPHNGPWRKAFVYRRRS